MKKQYKDPELLLVRFEDVITASSVQPTNMDNNESAIQSFSGD